MSKLSLTPSERPRLRQQLHGTHEARWYRRLLAVLELDQGKPVSEVARLLQVSSQCVYNWIDRFGQARQAAILADQDRSGRPTVWTEERLARLRALLACAPDRWGYFANDWTIPLLHAQLL